MPYIIQTARQPLTDKIDALSTAITDVLKSSSACPIPDKQKLPGLLNFAITSLIWQSYSKLQSDPSTPLSYSDYNAIIGVLECAKLELYRRKAATYEDEKINENGDVF